MSRASNIVNLASSRWPQALAVLTGLYVHLTNYCIIGLCTDELRRPKNEANFASTMFVLSVMLLLTHFRLWPETLRKPPKSLYAAYLCLVAAFFADLSHRLVWLSFQRHLVHLCAGLHVSVKFLKKVMGCGRNGFMHSVTQWLSKECSSRVLGSLFASLLLIWVLESTRGLKFLKDAFCSSPEPPGSSSGVSSLPQEERCSTRLKISRPKPRSFLRNSLDLGYDYYTDEE